ncbi:helix-turn-helix domain-containing protein [Herbidospora mongoliensis]|uniref:helix-turn-helix domain-containing protein n=1 Tax=Herbidospora mongoliensis TaxID=688067 RepID=UPI0009FE5CAA
MAGRLHMSSSALTKRVQRLEAQVGVTLVARGPQVCSPSPRRAAVVRAFRS